LTRPGPAASLDLTPSHLCLNLDPMARKRKPTDHRADPAVRFVARTKLLLWDHVERRLYQLPLSTLRKRYAEASRSPQPGCVYPEVEKRRHEILKTLRRRIVIVESARDYARENLDEPGVIDSVLALVALIKSGGHVAQNLMNRIADTYLDRYHLKESDMPAPGEGVVPTYDPRSGGMLVPVADRSASREMDELRKTKGA